MRTPKRSQRKVAKPTKLGAVIYCRVSTKDQLVNFSLDTQEKACTDFCQRKGLHVLKVFSAAESAKNADDREAFQAMLDYCRVHRHQVAAVVVHSVSRFARQTRDHQVAKHALKRNAVALHF